MSVKFIRQLKQAVNIRIFIFLLITSALWHFLSLNNDEAWIPNHKYINYNLHKEEPRDINQTCFVPRIHPFHPSILKYVKRAHPIRCRNIQSPLTWIDDEGVLRFNKTAWNHASAWSALKCEYAEVLRDNSKGNDVFRFNVSKPLLSETDVSHADFIRVRCKQFFGVIVYDYIHAHIRDNVKKTSSVINRHKHYNVLMFGIDSLSRLNAMRQLPKTFTFLKNSLKSYIFRGYFKVGGNTFPNLVSMLTGYHPYHRPAAYRPLEEEGKPHDDWPFVWKNYSNAGYRTMFAEDFPEFNMFHYMSGGFDRQPTDHYFRTFWTAIESTFLYKSSSYMCYANRPKHMIHIDYIKRFISRLSARIPFWGLSFLTEICHDYLNTVGATDDDMLDFIKFMRDDGILNNTVFIFFSDHGNRYSAMRQTYVGGIEDKMPLFTVFLPDRFVRSQPHAVANLERNVMRLTSSFDVYCMLVDILKLSIDPAHEIGHVSTLHGRSLFGGIPANRTCYEAGIDGEYCSCTEETEIAAGGESFVKNAAEHLVAKINSLLLKSYGNFDKCAKLYLQGVEGVRIVGDIKQLHKSTEKTFKVIFRTSPNDGLFEGAIRLAGVANDVIICSSGIERINRYGNQANCIDVSALRIFCYCL